MANSASFAANPVVKANDFQRQWSELGDAILEAVRIVGASGWYVLGDEVAVFERELARFWERRWAVGVANGLDAVEIGLRCLGCQPGEKVLLPPISAFATALAVVKLGAIPVFIDCDAFGLVDLTLAEQAVEADPAIRYFVPVHLYGHCLDLGHLIRLRDRFQLRIVEDCAQSIGASHRGMPCGSAGDLSATSFYPTKNLGALGDGGALLTDSEEVAQKARCLRDYGQTAKYCHDQIGYNSRLDELQAAVLRRVLLPRLADWTESRRSIAQRYLQQISNPRLAVVGCDPATNSCWHLFPILAPPGRKSDFLSHLRQSGIAGSEHYPTVLMEQPALKRIPHEQIGDCARSHDWCLRQVSLPIHPYLTDEEVARVIAACNSWT